ncbi:MAG: anaerobic sulfatase maturase [Chitinivibrionales bacterium]|nr:anaerobic sulfatase maturase [Chitinivibrionales bacterium]
MAQASRIFQVFAKPAGSLCNLSCHYCYYVGKKGLYPDASPLRMSDAILERYIVSHIQASTEPTIYFSWHGGEPTILGIDYFQKIVSLQRKHRPAHRTIANGLQTNGTLLDDQWCRFLAREGFTVGISMDGPRQFHNRYRVAGDQSPSFDRVLRGYEFLLNYGIPCEILCVVHQDNVGYPLEVYRFFKQLEARYVTFLPLVEPVPGTQAVSGRSVPARQFGEFLCSIFIEWKSGDVGTVTIQLFEEAARIAFQQDHSLCIFRKKCGGVPVIEHNGDFYSCDHFVDSRHCLGNISSTPLAELLESPAQIAFGQAKWATLPSMCRRCEVLDMCNGECPKNRFLKTPDGEPGLNYLCAGYKLFFTSYRPFVQQIAALIRQPNRENVPVSDSKPGRNSLCPCGSGKKYKSCCLQK